MDSSDLQPRRKAPTGSTRGVLLLFGGLFALVFIVQFLTIAWDIFAPRDQQPVLNKAEAEWVDPRLLAADPSAYRDRNIVLYGKALRARLKR